MVGNAKIWRPPFPPTSPYQIKWTIIIVIFELKTELKTKFHPSYIYIVQCTLPKMAYSRFKKICQVVFFYDIFSHFSRKLVPKYVYEWWKLNFLFTQFNFQFLDPLEFFLDELLNCQNSSSLLEFICTLKKKKWSYFGIIGKWQKLKTISSFHLWIQRELMTVFLPLR